MATLTIEDLMRKPVGQEEPLLPETKPVLPPEITPPVELPVETPVEEPVVKGLTIEDLQRKAPVEKQKDNSALTVEDVTADPERLGKIRSMMSAAKDIRYETAPPEEVMKDFMAHMRFLNVNELSVGVEAINVAAADEEKLAKYGEAYKIYDEMGSMFSNGDGWNGTLDYAQAMVTSPSLYLGLGIGKVAGNIGSRATANAVMSKAINVAAQAVVKKSGGKIAETLVQQQLKNTASKVAARYAIAGAVAVEAPFATLSDYMYQDVRMKTNVQDEYNFLEGALATLGGAASAIIPATVLLRSSNSVLGETGELVAKANRDRAKASAKKVAPAVESALKRLSGDWMKLAEAGKGMPENPALERAVASWFFDYKNEGGLVSILQKSGVQIAKEDPNLSQAMIEFAMGMGDEALEGFNKALEPVGITFGEATGLIAKTMKGAGEAFKPASDARKFFNEYQNLSVAKKTSRDAIVKELDEAADVEVADKEVAGYILSTWKKSLVSTYPTTAMNIKGWGLARAASSLSDIMLAGGYLGKAGIRAVIDPAGAVEDLNKVRSLAANQTFALKTLVDPYLSAEAFLTLLEKSAPTKTRKSLTGQIFGGVDDRGPARFGLNGSKGVVKGVEAVTDFAQRVSFVRLQDTLTKGISGLTALDKQSRLNFGKGVEQLIKDGEVYKLTDEMWESVSKSVLRETFSEDLTKGNKFLGLVAGMVEGASKHPVLGYVIPFGKFMNNAMAFTYRHSPLGYWPAVARVFGKEASEPLEESVARATVGTLALGYMASNEAAKQEEGLQWFERRTDDGSIENITNVFPLSLYALLGRIWTNTEVGEGMVPDLIEDLKKQLGPLDSLDNMASPTWLKDVTKFLVDEKIENEEKNEFIVFVQTAMAAVGETAAGFTRPLDIYSRGLSHALDAAGGGVAIDRKQARGMDNVILGMTKYVSGFFNLAFGEENEYGVTMYGEPKESSLIDGPVKTPNPVGIITGTTYQSPAKNINKLLGMVDKPPYKAENFTSGVPEYDAFVNKRVTPLLDNAADRMMNNSVFKAAPQSVQIKMVDSMIRNARTELLSLLDGGVIGDEKDVLVRERGRFMVRDRPARRRAMKELEITTPEHKLSLFQMEAIRRRMDLEKEIIEDSMN